MKADKTNLFRWVDERLGLLELFDFAKKKTVPVHKHTFWYYWGGLVAVFLPRPGVHRCVVAGVLPARPGRLRIRAPDHVRHQLRLADPLGALVGGQPHDRRDFRAYVLGLLHESLPESARIRLVERHRIADGHDGLRFQRLSSADECAGVFRDQGGVANPGHVSPG